MHESSTQDTRSIVPSGDTSDPCYVCLQEGGRQRCMCSAPIHDECIKRLIKSVPTAAGGECAVCKTMYIGVKLNETFHLEHDIEFMFTFAILATFTMLLCGSCAYLVWMGRSPIAETFAKPLVFVLWINSMTICMTCSHQISRHGCRATLLCQKRVKERCIVLDEPSASRAV